MHENEEIILRTYSSVWKIDRKIYSFEGMKLIVPIVVNELSYLAASFIITYLLIRIVPFFDRLHFIIKYIAIPYGLMKLFTSIKLDGKLPHKFMFDYALFKLNPKQYCRFQPVTVYKKMKFETPVLFRRSKVINKTDIVVKKN